ncbi:MAG: dihydroorotate dehydrogenase electron transfer subunit [Nitrospirota bacterium]
MNRYFRAKIIDNLPLNTKTSLLTIAPLEPAINPEPGQFYMIEVGNSYDPLLKRPFSYFRKISEGIQFLYTVKGKGTALMKDFKQESVINVLGPLGIGYPGPPKGYIPLLIAGGIGIASIFSLAEVLAKKAYVLYGAKSKNELLMLNELKSLGNELIISTDDGSIEAKGTVTDVLNVFLTSHFSFLTSCLLYACGPKPMLKAVSKIAIDNDIRGYISLEENMACGVGACLGCAVRVRSQKSEARSQRLKDFNSSLIYKRVCKEGPIFPIEDIVW